MPKTYFKPLFDCQLFAAKLTAKLTDMRKYKKLNENPKVQYVERDARFVYI